MRFLFKDGLESVQKPKPFSEHRLRSTPPCLLLVPSSASKPPKKTSVTRARFSLQKVILSFAKGFYEVLHGHNRTEKWKRNEGLIMLVASALNGLLSVLTWCEDSGVNALKQHRQYKYQRLPDIFSSFRGNLSSDMTSYSCNSAMHAMCVFSSKPKRQRTLRCVNFMRCPRGMWLLDDYRCKKKQCTNQNHTNSIFNTRKCPVSQ